MYKRLFNTACVPQEMCMVLATLAKQPRQPVLVLKEHAFVAGLVPTVPAAGMADDAQPMQTDDDDTAGDLSDAASMGVSGAQICT